MNLAAIILGGSDTTSTVLIYCFYIMAKLPEEQDKLINEIDNIFSDSSTVGIYQR
jgi:cytochrome P450